MDPPFFCAIDRTYILEYNDNATSVAEKTKRGNEYPWCFDKLTEFFGCYDDGDKEQRAE